MKSVLQKVLTALMAIKEIIMEKHLTKLQSTAKRVGHFFLLSEVLELIFHILLTISHSLLKAELYSLHLNLLV